MDNADRLKKLRNEMGMNRKEFCDYYLVPYRTMTDWEAGKRKMPEYLLLLMEYKAAHECLLAAENTQEADHAGHRMNQRDKEVLNMQLILIPLLAEAWNKSYAELAELFKKYGLLNYIDVSYEKYNSTGNQGIIEDLEEFINDQGGKIA